MTARAWQANAINLGSIREWNFKKIFFLLGGRILGQIIGEIFGDRSRKIVEVRGSPGL
jgi:hypothetical protein